MKSLVVVLTIALSLPALAAFGRKPKACTLELNTEYKTMYNEDTTNAATPDSFANLSARLKAVMHLQSNSEIKALIDPKNIQARENFNYGKGANVLQAGDLRRAFHPKAHGCVNAELRIDYDLSQVEGIGSDIGVFNKKDGKLQTYTDAIVRLSNARGHIQNDNSDDLRGFAIKLKNVEGTRLETRAEEERNTQDFLFTNAPVHFAKDAPEMVRFAEAMAGGGILGAFNPMNYILPWRWGGLGKKWEALGNAIKASKDTKENRTGSVLTARYYSRTPFLVGKKAAKFSVTPAPCNWWSEDKGLTPYTYRDDPGTTSQPKWAKSEEPLAFNFLRDDMIRRLDPTSGDDVCFDFNVQFQVDACKQPIEEADVEWKADEAPVIRVGQIRIPKQIFAGVDTPSAQDYMCEDITYNPWHALAAHKPLGNMNRARQHVYYEVQKMRLGKR